MPVLTSSPARSLGRLDSSSGKESSGWPAGIAAIAVFSVMSVTMALTSRGFLEGDACSHFLTARGAFHNASYLLSVWGRPFCTGLYAIPAHYFGRLGVDLTSLAVAILISLITRSIAVKQGGQGFRWPMLALIFVLAQPLVFLHSFSELTELPFALLVAMGFWAYQRRLFLLFALVMGLGPLSRPEGFGFLGLAFAALVLHRRGWWTAVLLMPLVLWDYFGWRVNGRVDAHWWLWLKHNWPYAEESLYEKGPLLYFVSVLPAVISPFIFPAAVVGGWLCLRAGLSPSPGTPGEGRGGGSSVGSWKLGIERPTSNVQLPTSNPEQNHPHPNPLPEYREREAERAHLRRCELLIVVLPLLIVIGHSLLYWLGKMASNGEVRYMMVVAPFWALLSARGWAWIFTTMSWRRPLLWAGFAAMLPVLVNRAWTVIPMDNMPDWREAEQIAIWYHTPEIEKRYPHILNSHVGLQYYLAIDPDNGQELDFKKSVIDSRPRDTLLVWDRVGALFNSDAQRKVPLDEIRKAGWKPLKTRWTDGAGEWQFFVSE